MRARRIRTQLRTTVPILLISAYDWSDIEGLARSAGVNGFISKPLFKSTLFHGLKQFIQSDEPVPAPRSNNTNLAGRRVLLAEDSELNWEVAEALLTELGLTLDWAENGKLCLEMFQASALEYYDAILMDIRMPVMNGYEATKAIRAMERPDAARIPIIAMTADAFSEDVKRCLDCGMDAHTAKPIDIKEVAHLLERLLESRS